MKGKIITSTLVIAASLMLTPAAGMAGWNVSIGIGLPGYFYYEAAPEAFPVPYGPVGPAVGPAYFSGGVWYRPAGGRWFFAVQLNGPWTSIAAESVPSEVIGAPVYQGPGQDADGRYIPPRLYYEGDE